MELRSQEVRTLAPENDPLKMGMGWKVEDLSKPQIMVESTFGDSHPGSAHLDQFVKEAVQAVNDNGGKAARYLATDMCDGIAQGHDGINYSLPHRDAIVNLVEAQANASVYDGGVFIASCDKSVPAMLMSIGRLKDMSAIVVTGGVMEAHTLPKEYVVNDPACAINDLLTLEQIGKFDAWEKTGVIPNEQLDYYKHNACPSCGACSFMGTAATMQIMAEALGLMLPGTALMPATAPELKQAAYDDGVHEMKLVDEGKIALTPAVELSYLQPSEQEMLFSVMDSDEVTPSLSQARRLRRMSEAQTLTDDAVLQLLSEVKGNQVEYVKVPVDKLRSFFRPDTSVKQMTETLVKAMDFYNKHLARQRKDRDAR